MGYRHYDYIQNTAILRVDRPKFHGRGKGGSADKDKGVQWNEKGNARDHGHMYARQLDEKVAFIHQRKHRTENYQCTGVKEFVSSLLTTWWVGSGGGLGIATSHSGDRAIELLQTNTQTHRHTGREAQEGGKRPIFIFGLSH